MHMNCKTKHTPFQSAIMRAYQAGRDGDGGGKRATAAKLAAEYPVENAAHALLAAAQRVIANWEHGDLAAAVRQLAAIIAEAEGG